MSKGSAVKFFQHTQLPLRTFFVQLSQAKKRKEGKDGVSAGSDRDGDADFSGSDGCRIWAKTRVAMDSYRPWNRRPFSEYKKSGSLDHDNHRDFDPGYKILLHPNFDPNDHQDLLSTSPSDPHRSSMALEI
jgi:hypothetical protein